MWIFTSAAVNIYFVLQYMMYICENKNAVVVKTSGSQGSFEHNGCVSVPFCFVLTAHHLEVRVCFTR